ncbi:hypothetical protein NDU88_003066 [Pleurodeles waltl]|uniref:Uncharacterized protein n=1 Tax=Pleurodeles waltl TaxID=8319 RepID=A0AAV7UBP1_PLEWA|nr:hypothetical protein NDU88_003066 [Pleurodeles waltl]
MIVARGSEERAKELTAAEEVTGGWIWARSWSWETILIGPGRRLWISGGGQRCGATRPAYHGASKSKRERSVSTAELKQRTSGPREGAGVLWRLLGAQGNSARFLLSLSGPHLLQRPSLPPPAPATPTTRPLAGPPPWAAGRAQERLSSPYGAPSHLPQGPCGLHRSRSGSLLPNAGRRTHPTSRTPLLDRCFLAWLVRRSESQRLSPAPRGRVSPTAGQHPEGSTGDSSAPLRASPAPTWCPLQPAVLPHSFRRLRSMRAPGFRVAPWPGRDCSSSAAQRLPGGLKSGSADSHQVRRSRSV